MMTHLAPVGHEWCAWLAFLITLARYDMGLYTPRYDYFGWSGPGNAGYSRMEHGRQNISRSDLGLTGLILGS
jgi:hypothetical protein